MGETPEQAAVREAFEEVSLRVTLQLLLGCYSHPQRDPRGHTVSPVYIAHAKGEPRAADDAAEVHIVDTHAVPDQLVFDHGLILADYQQSLAGGQVTPLRV